MSKQKKGTFLRMAAAFILACVMAFALAPTWAIAEDSASSTSANSTIVADPLELETTKDESAESNSNDSTQDSSTSASETSSDTSTQTVSTAAKEETITESNDESSDASSASASALSTEAAQGDVSVKYQAHVQNIGWMGEVANGETAGTSGRALRVEALKINLDKGTSGLDGGIEYNMHVQNIGWQGTVRDGEVGGTFGRALRVEAMTLSLYGDVANAYDVYYSVHAQNKGWMGWAKNGEKAGTIAQGLRLEAIKIVLVRKNGPAPDASFVNFASPYDAQLVRVQSHVQNIGWQGAVGNGEVSGTTGRGLRMEALKVTTPGLEVSGNVQISGHVQNIGWMDYKDGFAGTTGRGLRLEAVKMRLTGEAAEQYNLYYRVHISNIGWLGWTLNGEAAGSEGMGARVEAIQVRLVKAGEEIDTSGSVTDEPFLTGTSVYYQAHCQDYGWRDVVSNGGTAGTTGQNKRLEAYKVGLSGGTIGGSVEYSSYVAGSGWQGFVQSDNVSGTVGTGTALEGVKMYLTGRAANMYNIYYRAHVQDAGWLGWARNGEEAGAPGTGRKVEAIQIRLVSKNAGAPGSTANHVVNKAYFDDEMTKKAQGYSSSTGWLIMVNDGKTKLGVYRGSQGNWKKHDSWVVSTGAAGSPSTHGVFSVSGRGYSFGHGYTCYYWVSWNGPYLFHSIKYNEGTFDVQDGRLGYHISGGCVRMPLDKAKWIHDVIPDGTTVVVY